MPKQEPEYYPTAIDADGLPRDTPTARTVDEGVEVAIVARAQGVIAVRDVCPHMGAPMSEGTYCAKDNTLQCPWHGYRFNADTGAFVENPNEKYFAKLQGLYKTYRPEKRPNYKLQALPCEVKDGKVRVRRPSNP